MQTGQRWSYEQSAVDDVAGDDTLQHQTWTEDEPWRRSLSSRVRRFPKTLFGLSRCRIPKAKGSGDLLSCSPVHADARDGEDYSGGAAAREGKTLTQIRYSYEFPNLGDSTYSDLWCTFFMREVIRIYWETNHIHPHPLAILD